MMNKNISVAHQHSTFSALFKICRSYTLVSFLVLFFILFLFPKEIRKNKKKSTEILYIL